MKIGQIRKVIDVSVDDINEILVGAFEAGDLINSINLGFINKKDIKADIKNLYDITVKLIDSNRQSKDESKKTMTAVNAIKDIMVKLFKGNNK